MLSFLLPFHPTGKTAYDLQLCRYRANCRLQRKHVKCLANTFHDAVTKGYVRDFGRVVPLNRQGRALPSTDLSVPAEFQMILDAVILLILSTCGQANVRAIFIRGSIVTGNFSNDGCSDIDLILFTRKVIHEKSKLKILREVRWLLKEHIQFASVDMTFEYDQSTRVRRVPPKVNQSLSTILRHYSVSLYGSLQDVYVPTGWLAPSLEIAINIREEERCFEVAFKRAATQSNFGLQHLALQWLCKRCLRAVADECSRDVLVHCRDLVPCFQVACAQFPQFSVVFLNALQIACASSRNNFCGLSKSDFLTFGLEVARDAIEIVEYIYLKRHFHLAVENRQSPPQITTPRQNLIEFMFRGLACFRYRVMSLQRVREKARKIYYHESRLPRLAILPNRLKEDYNGSYNNSQNREKRTFSDLLSDTAHPFVIRNVAQLCGTDEMLDRDVVVDMVQHHLKVDCRLSPDNIVTFCKLQHVDIKNGLFTPPSVLRRIDIREALYRMQAECSLPPLMYDKCEREHIYIQTKAQKDQHVFPNASDKVLIAQEERIWISNHGTVSSLHYDASHSALFQRKGRKRMILFPKEALPLLGVYPLGHPLHRRAGVNLSRSQSYVYMDFWDKCSHTAVEVWMNPGDLLLFPPFWAHYTESITNNAKELCVSHTLRYISCPG